MAEGGIAGAAGRHALVTGGASGIGAAACTALLAGGWTVTSLDLRPSPLAEVRSVEADVTDEAGLRAAVASAGPLQALVCSAGVSGSSVGDGPVSSAGAAAFDAVMAVNLRGAFLAAGAAWPALVARPGAAIVTVSSVLGLTGGGGPFRSHAYVAAKGGLVSLTKALAAAGAEHGLRANCVAPGLVRTPLAGRVSSDPALSEWVAAKQPLLGGLMEPADVGGLIAFLCGDGARAVTAQTIAVDAGWQLDVQGPPG